ncbi:PPE family protein [Mycobacterium ostraviense]|uniref:PPE family protein n=1 Tax=Mycobacterium ostraviense TaxID=2738409 RepID=UPI000B02C81A|nr:PPE family protein [Mycobacterium ostraviense]UGT90440.1 PPE family protein [Mycobacterium ostraviense]
MDFIALSPEVTSALIHSGPGAKSLLEAANAWQRLPVEMEETVRAFVPALSYAAEAWHGPSSSVMIDAVGPYLSWMRTTAQQCQQPGILGAARRSGIRLYSLDGGSPLGGQCQPDPVGRVAGHHEFGRNLVAIAETEAQYETMWVNNSAAMYRYEAASAQALPLTQFASPPSIVDPAGLAAQANLEPTVAATAAPAAAVSPVDAVLPTLGVTFDPNSGWFGLANTYANQFISWLSDQPL